MPQDEPLPPLKFLHFKEILIQSKLIIFERLSNDTLVQSLAPGSRDCLKVRPDGTIIDGHHRVHTLRSRGLDVDSLPREIIKKEEVKE